MRSDKSANNIKPRLNKPTQDLSNLKLKQIETFDT